MIGLGFAKHSLKTDFGKWELLFVQILCFQVSFSQKID